MKNYLDCRPEVWETIKKDIRKHLIPMINKYREYDLELRKKSFNIYYQGNSLAEVTPVAQRGQDGVVKYTYTAKIHWKFLPNKLHNLKNLTLHDDGGYVRRKSKGNLWDELPDDMKKYPHRLSKDTKTGSHNRYAIFKGIPSRDFHRFFQKKNLSLIASNIGKQGRSHGEERILEQVLISENSPSPNFVIIDRQVAVHRGQSAHRGQMDILALSRKPEDERFHFVVIEVKLGINPDLRRDVAMQLKEYVQHVEENIAEFADCYERNYRRKIELGIFDVKTGLAPTIKIDRRNGKVRAWIIVGGYLEHANQAVSGLKSWIEDEKLDIKLQVIRNKPKLAEIS